jgi:hypothetical protein
LKSDYAEPSLTSFEAYQATRDRERRANAMPGVAEPKPDSIPTVQLRAQYEALRADRFAREHDDAVRSLISSFVLFVVAVVLFVLHWRWLGQLASQRGDLRTLT